MEREKIKQPVSVLSTSANCAGGSDVGLLNGVNINGLSFFNGSATTWKLGVSEDHSEGDYVPTVGRWGCEWPS